VTLTEPGTIRVLTLNLWGRRGPVERRTAALVEHLQRARYDIIALQEVEGTGRRSQAHGLAEAVGHDQVLLTRTGRMPIGGEGLAIISDLALEPLDRLDLPSSIRDHPRALQQAVAFLPDGRAVLVANTHLAWRLEDTDLRTEQTTAIRRGLASWTGPVVLAGDLNDEPGSAPLEALTGPHPGWDPLVDVVGAVDAADAADAVDRPTFDERNPHLWQPELAGRRVDHLLVRGFEVERAAIVLTGEETPLVSDHYGVGATLRRTDGADRT
jgi:endonuclease/exonuclease/phosphatase family metal-dependent hydrolase